MLSTNLPRVLFLVRLQCTRESGSARGKARRHQCSAASRAADGYRPVHAASRAGIAALVARAAASLLRRRLGQASPFATATRPGRRCEAIPEITRVAAGGRRGARLCLKLSRMIENGPAALSRATRNASMTATRRNQASQYRETKPLPLFTSLRRAAPPRADFGGERHRRRRNVLFRLPGRHPATKKTTE